MSNEPNNNPVRAKAPATSPTPEVPVTPAQTPVVAETTTPPPAPAPATPPPETTPPETEPAPPLATQETATEVKAEAAPAAPVKKRALSKKKKRAAAKTQHTYAHDVYKRRFKHFRNLRLLSFFIGGSIFVLLCLGMWQLYTMVFSTIEDTEHLFLITEKRRTNTIQFQILEDVRTSWDLKYNATTSPMVRPLFYEPPPPVEEDAAAEDETT